MEKVIKGSVIFFLIRAKHSYREENIEKK